MIFVGDKGKFTRGVGAPAPVASLDNFHLSAPSAGMLAAEGKGLVVAPHLTLRLPHLSSQINPAPDAKEKFAQVKLSPPFHACVLPFSAPSITPLYKLSLLSRLVPAPQLNASNECLTQDWESGEAWADFAKKHKFRARPVPKLVRESIARAIEERDKKIRQTESNE